MKDKDLIWIDRALITVATLVVLVYSAIVIAIWYWP